MQDLRNKVRLARQSLAQEPGDSEEPSIGAIAVQSGLTEVEIRDGLKAINGFSALSLEAGLLPSDGEGYSLVDALGAPDGAYEIVIDREAIKSGLEHLPECERSILYMRFFEDMTQSRIAEKFGISQMHARLIRDSCMRVREEAGRDWDSIDAAQAA
ncbi:MULTISPECIES: sigma factor-like helix-turn-helix DNA-binding protein [Streptomyces]|uniref:sigma factor-like helix-turn-helix DNA-binding protein n=1 Tax=Streptomyces sp. NPDC021470 TaxID=3154902 RepID=UPI001D0BC958|nr:sigma factor-like helix-turn-helix DNA-binding protein [Streptomyces longhuiensis]UDL96905.1 hypothetical protein LGI35_00610 [Streptomyces longhuiensis]